MMKRKWDEKSSSLCNTWHICYRTLIKILSKIFWDPVRFYAIQYDVFYVVWEQVNTSPVEAYSWAFTRHAQLRVAHDTGMTGTFYSTSKKPQVSDPGMHHGTYVTHVPWYMVGWLTRRWRGKRSQHSRRMSNPQFYVSGKRPYTHSRDALQVK